MVKFGGGAVSLLTTTSNIPAGAYVLCRVAKGDVTEDRNLSR